MVVAGLALTALLAMAAVPGSTRSQGSSPATTTDGPFIEAAQAASFAGTAVTTPTLDPAYRSEGALSATMVIVDPDRRPPPAIRPDASVVQPPAPLRTVTIPEWRLDRDVSWYGPGFYGNRTACGYAMTSSLRGVAHRTLPCGTLVTFRNPANGRTITVPVVDRGPYVSGRQWDLTAGTCLALGHCYTGSIGWKLA
jgi:hypothetical protein